MKKVFIVFLIFLLCFNFQISAFAMAYMPPKREEIINSIINPDYGVLDVESLTITYDCTQKIPMATYVYQLRNPTQSVQTVPIAYFLDNTENLEVKENDIPIAFSVNMIYFLGRIPNLEQDTINRGYSYLSYTTDSMCQIIDYYKNFESEHISLDKEIYVYEYTLKEGLPKLTGSYNSSISIIDAEDFDFDANVYSPSRQAGTSGFSAERTPSYAYGDENKTTSYFIEIQPNETGASTVKLDSLEGVTITKMSIKDFLLQYTYDEAFMYHNKSKSYALSKEAFLKYHLESMESSYDYYNTENQTDIYWKVYDTSHLTFYGLPNDRIYFADIPMTFGPLETKTLTLRHKLILGYETGESDNTKRDTIYFDPRYMESFNQTGPITVAIKTPTGIYNSNLDSLQAGKEKGVYTAAFDSAKKEALYIAMPQP